VCCKRMQYQPKKRSTAPSPALQRELVVQGKTFAQWQELLQTELDPLIRAEAIHAFALFGANGRGKETAETIIDAVKGVHFRNFQTLESTDDPVVKMKNEAVSAFVSQNVRIPVEDSLPVLWEKFAGNNENEQQFAQAVFVFWWSYQSFNAEHQAFVYDKLMHWDVKNPKYERPLFLLRLLLQWNNDMVLKFVRETIQKKDAVRFQWLFVDFTPLEFRQHGQGKVLRVEHWVQYSKVIVPALFADSRHAAFPGYSFSTEDGEYFIENPVLTPFGRSLLALLREEGVKSDIESIRTTSQKVVDALTQIGE